MDVFSDLLQGSKVLDLVQLVAGILQQLLVNDDAEALVAVADGAQLAVSIVQVVSIGAQFLSNGGVLQIVAVFAPSLNGSGVANYEQSGSVLALVHFGSQGGLVLTGSSGNDLDLYAGLLGVSLSQRLQSLLSFGLEVQPIDRTLFVATAGAGNHTQCQNQNQQQCKELFHDFFLLFVPIIAFSHIWKRFQSFPASSIPLSK